MAHLIIRPSWYLPEAKVTPENRYLGRREFLRSLGLLGLASSGLALGESLPPSRYPYLPAKRNAEFDPKLALSDEKNATHYNNFYEFSTTKTRVSQLVGKFVVDPWTVTVGGLCKNPLRLGLDDLAKDFAYEERVYRFRCVEAWSMVVPWTGFPLADLIKKAEPKSEAKFVKFVTVSRPDQMPGIELLPDYPWPYTEGLRLDEAMNPLVLAATGLYGKPLPKQNGAPIRIVVPWKYGYKSIKSVVQIEFTASQPATLWETLNPREYPFESNVDPAVRHPRWSQSTERVVDTGDRIETLPYNGYASSVASLYSANKK
jgi:sulfoxide reductase catalytic subunit YedY